MQIHCTSAALKNQGAAFLRPFLGGTIWQASLNAEIVIELG